MFLKIVDIYKIFSLLKAFFFYFFWFSIYKMVDSKYSTGNCESSKISIGIVMKNTEMLKFVSDHLKAKRKLSM